MKWTSWVTAATLAGVIGFVVWSSLHVGLVRCEVCIDFAGRQACRSVDASTRSEAHASAVNNACAFLASGVTQVMACERTPPTREHCDD
jgi:hypothetical protein